MEEFQNIPWNDITHFGQQTMLKRPLFTVSWILGRFCNYECSYCWPYARSSTPDYHKFKTYTDTIDKIKSQARDNGFTQFHFSFSGGEPTAYKHFGRLIEYYCNDAEASYQSIHMTTNLSPSKLWWERWIKNTNFLQRKSITASFHAEFADEKKFADKCLFLMDQNVYVTINQVMVPEKFNEYYDRCKRFSDKGINVTLKPQSDPTASYIVGGYTDDQKFLLQTGFPQFLPDGSTKESPLMQVELVDSTGEKHYIDQAERFNAYGFNKFKGWNCNAGYQGIVIRENEVKRSYSCKDVPLGTLNDGFEIFKSPMPCITDTCVSSADSKIPKQKN